MIKSPLTITPGNKKDILKFAELADLALIFLSLDFCVTDFNDVASCFYQWNKKEILNKSIIQWCQEHSLDLPLLPENKNVLLKELKNGKNLSLERVNNINRYRVLWKISVSLDFEKNPNGIVLIGQKLTHEHLYKNYSNNNSIYTELHNISKEILGYDIGEKKTVRDYMVSVYNYLENIIAYMPCYVYWKDNNFIYLGCNDLTAKLLNLSSRKTIIGMTDYDFGWKKEDVDAFRKIDEEIIKTKKPKLNIEEIIYNKHGAINLLVNKMPIFNKNHAVIGIAGISIDITAQKRIEKENSNYQYIIENILYNLPGFIYWKNQDSRYIGFNKNVLQLSGLTKEEFYGKTDDELIWGPEHAKSFQDIDKEVMKTGQKKITEDQLPIKNSDGHFIIIRTEKTRLYDKEGNIAGVLGVAMDVTEQRYKELEDIRQKLEGMTLVSASFAHELRTPLTTLSIGIRNLKEYIPTLLLGYQMAEQANLPVTKIKPRIFQLLNKLLDSMESETRAASTFIDIMLMNVDPHSIVATMERDKGELFSIASCVEDAIARYPFQEGEKELVRWEHDTDFTVKGRASLVIHVIFNLFKNALYYIAKANKGNIFIWLENGEPYNKLYFKDTGSGISKDILPHIFDQFFSRTYHGAGIGLSFCKMVMKSLGGEITCTSEEGGYTQFMLSFPITSDK